MSDGPPPAARWEDLIAHNQSQLLRFFGELAMGLASAWAAAKFLRLVVALNPAGLAFFLASLALEYAAGKLVDLGADKLGELLSEPGIMGIEKGSNNVSVNRRPLARGGTDGDPLKCHRGKKIIEGSEWVAVNTKPAARINDWTNDSGKVATGSPNVFIGGPRVSANRQSEWQTFLSYAFTVVDLTKAYRKGWTEVGKTVFSKGASRGADATLDAAWDFIRQ